MRRTERVFVENLGIHGFHGLIPAEKTLGQKFYADIECLVSRTDPPSDTMEDAVDYGKLCDLAHDISASGPFNLIETLAELEWTNKRTRDMAIDICIRQLDHAIKASCAKVLDLSTPDKP